MLAQYKKYPNFKKNFLILSFIVMFTTVTYFFSQRRREQHIMNYNKLLRSGFTSTNNSSACHIPEINPFDSSILKFIEQPRPLVCKERQAYLTYIDFAGFLRLNETSLKDKGYKVNENLWCTYQTFNKQNVNDDTLYFNDSLPLIEPVLITTDFVTVNCKTFAGLSVYTNYHAHIFVRPEFELDNFNAEKKLNVVLFGVDSMSRLNFIRQLPNTYKYLSENMKMFVLEAYTKVGDNTFANVMPLLSGLHPYNNHLKESPTADFIDNWPLMWKNFSSAGYVTYFSEDRPKISIFNYLSKGFKNTPTDYYMRPFWLALESAHITNWFSSHLCFGNTPKHMYIFNWFLDFIKKFQHIPHFIFSFITDLAHEHLNQIKLVDEDFRQLFQELYEGGYLNNTVLSIFSDHGHRFDSIRTTVVGRIEERLPFNAIYLPPWLQSKYPQIISNIKYNKHRLLSPYDFYQTLLLILRNNFTGINSVAKRFNLTFFDKVDEERECADAQIPEHYCVCHQESTMSTNDETVMKGAEFLLKTMNDMLVTPGSKCVNLTLRKIKDAQMLLPRDEISENANSLFITLRITIEVMPSKGLFESTLKYDINEKSLLVLDDISRINKYGNQSYCTNDRKLKKFCYCNLPSS